MNEINFQYIFLSSGDPGKMGHRPKCHAGKNGTAGSMGDNGHRKEYIRTISIVTHFLK